MATQKTTIVISAKEMSDEIFFTKTKEGVLAKLEACKRFEKMGYKRQFELAGFTKDQKDKYLLNGNI
jgi:hypothetical protein